MHVILFLFRANCDGAPLSVVAEYVKSQREAARAAKPPHGMTPLTGSFGPGKSFLTLVPRGKFVHVFERGRSVFRQFGSAIRL